MLKKIGFSLLCLATILTTNTYAVLPNHTPKAGVTLEFELPPNQPQYFINYMFWSIETKCKITSEDDSDVLYAVALAKQGRLNDIPWSKGDSLRLTIRNGDIMTIYAESGSKVSVTNEGKHTILATCSS